MGRGDEGSAGRRPARIVALRCADRLIGCWLEPGGKNPLLILDGISPVRQVQAVGTKRGLPVAPSHGMSGRRVAQC